ncbi:MAG: hypothetical protein CFK52_06600 [Chloracidobacterium sp. CP2_5A]|nr:MAG: hypothetical protein CFK52_06600 [Chloracidobacterium sp. CP2_5A]
MCNQSVGLIQAAFENEGIVTVSISLYRFVTEKVRPPRALCVPFPLGYPLGAPNDPALQRRVILAALDLLTTDEPPPIIRDFQP